MRRTQEQLRADALAIWQAGVDAVRGDRLIAENVRVDGEFLVVGDEPLPLASIDRIVVVGAGKAGAGMAAGLEAALGERLLAEKQVAGWLNVPADCVRPLARIKLHAARPAGINEPTAEGVAGAEAILNLVSQAGPRDLVFCLLSGGGSALLPLPVEGVSLTDKLALTQFLSAAGATITELNTVRKQLSRIKGNGLARACRAGRLISLIISDVIGDPLDMIASGPTVPDSSAPQDALAVLERFGAIAAGVAPSAIVHLRKAALESGEGPRAPSEATNLVIGNNAVAVDAAGVEAVRRGYSHAMISATTLEGQAEELGRHYASLAFHMRHKAGPDCLITGGEPVVKLVDAASRGRGGRNQQLVLAALDQLLLIDPESLLAGICLLSGGTDGEDGPTDAAGALADEALVGEMRKQKLVPADFLARNDAYHFFEPLRGLIKTGPTHTNVCDVRVIVVDRG
jgi:glycerate 2-kinase